MFENLLLLVKLGPVCTLWENSNTHLIWFLSTSIFFIQTSHCFQPSVNNEVFWTLTLCILQIMSKSCFSHYFLISPLSPLLIYSLKSIEGLGVWKKKRNCIRLQIHDGFLLSVHLAGSLGRAAVESRDNWVGFVILQSPWNSRELCSRCWVVWPSLLGFVLDSLCDASFMPAACLIFPFS